MLLWSAGIVALGLIVAARAGSFAVPPAHGPTWSGPAVGGAWSPTPLRLPTNALLLASRDPTMVIAGTSDGAWASGDGGAHWTRAGRGLRGNTIAVLAADPVGDALFAGSDDGAVYARDDGGTWRRISPPLAASPVFSLAAARDGRTLLAGTIGGLVRGVASGAGWLWRPVARTGQAAVTSIAWSPTRPRSAVAAVFGTSPPVLASDDGGQTWHAASAGLPSTLPTQALLPVAVPRTGIVLTTMGGGVWERTDGTAWRDVGAGLPARHAMPLAALPGSAPAVLYAGTMGFGVYVKEGAAAWRALGRGLRGGDNTILALVVVAGSRPTLLTATIHGVSRYVPA